MNYVEFYYSTPATLESFNCVVVDNQVVRSTRTGKVKPMPRVSICGVYIEETHTLTFGVARCSPTDQFNKKIGKELSFKRALKSPFAVYRNVKEETMKETMRSVFCSIERLVLSDS